ncbi:MAG: putative AAA+ superfamily ATPase [Halieaceae bacterium]
MFAVLRGFVDKNREQGRTGGQLLPLGSALMDLMRQSSESLAGRISDIEMSGLNIAVINGDQQNRQTLWLRGSFPDSYLTADDDVAMDWLENLIRTYLERDIPQMGFRVPAARLRRLWTMPSSEVWAVEIKYGVAPKIGNHYSQTCDDLGATHKYILYGGEDEFPVGKQIKIISLPRLMEKLCSA